MDIDGYSTKIRRDGWIQMDILLKLGQMDKDGYSTNIKRDGLIDGYPMKIRTDGWIQMDIRSTKIRGNGWI